jgi:hypothetical protein
VLFVSAAILAVTGGWAGATLVTIAFASMFVLLVRAWRRQEHGEESAFALAGIGALLSLILHGLVRGDHERRIANQIEATSSAQNPELMTMSATSTAPRAA